MAERESILVVAEKSGVGNFWHGMDSQCIAHENVS